MLLLGATGAFAGKFDGSSPLLCAATQTVSCDSLGDCVKGPADAVNLPVFMKFDPGKKAVISAKEGGEPRTSKILQVDNQESALVLVGIDPAGGWGASIDKAAGDMTLSIAVNGQGYLVFGSCLER
jgi:hypothetical protein